MHRSQSQAQHQPMHPLPRAQSTTDPRYGYSQPGWTPGHIDSVQYEAYPGAVEPSSDMTALRAQLAVRIFSHL